MGETWRIGIAQTSGPSSTGAGEGREGSKSPISGFFCFSGRDGESVLGNRSDLN